MTGHDLQIGLFSTRMCENCGVLLVRHRYRSGQLERPKNFACRRSCSTLCRKALQIHAMPERRCKTCKTVIPRVIYANGDLESPSLYRVRKFCSRACRLGSECSDRGARFLGTLCKRKHAATEDPSRSWRYKRGPCCECMKQVVADRHAERFEQTRKTKSYKDAKRASERRRRIRPEVIESRKIAGASETAKASRANYRRRQEVRERCRTYMKRWRKERASIDPSWTIEYRLRGRLRDALVAYTDGGKILRSDEYGVSYKAIIESLGRCPGDLHDYVIDHIRPLCSFDLTDPAQVKIAFAPENHRWLTRQENQAKAAQDKRLSVRPNKRLRRSMTRTREGDEADADQ